MLTEALQTENQDLPDVGTRLEVCLDGMALAQDMASLVAKNTGSAVIIDYGEDFALQDSIRVGPSQPLLSKPVSDMRRQSGITSTKTSSSGREKQMSVRTLTFLP